MIMRMVVDLPAPLGPRNPVTRPGRTVKETRSTAAVLPYLLVRFCASIIGVPSARDFASHDRTGGHRLCDPAAEPVAGARPGTGEGDTARGRAGQANGASPGTTSPDS